MNAPVGVNKKAASRKEFRVSGFEEESKLSVVSSQLPVVDERQSVTSCQPPVISQEKAALTFQSEIQNLQTSRKRILRGGARCALAGKRQTSSCPRGRTAHREKHFLERYKIQNSRLPAF
jgi:hypothetical protein